MPPSRMPAQVFVRGLDGRSRCVDPPLRRLAERLPRPPLPRTRARAVGRARGSSFSWRAARACTRPRASPARASPRAARAPCCFASPAARAGSAACSAARAPRAPPLQPDPVPVLPYRSFKPRIRAVLEAERKIREHARTQPQRDLERLALAHIKAKETGAKRKFAKIEEEEKERYARDECSVRRSCPALCAPHAAAADQVLHQKNPRLFRSRRRREDARTSTRPTRRARTCGDPLARGGVERRQRRQRRQRRGRSDADAVARRRPTGAAPFA